MITKRSRVLLVDDEVSVTTTLTIFLRLSGFEVEIAHDGMDALEKVHTVRPDIVVLDVIMPGMDGREALRRLRDQNNWIPVILLTQVTGTAERIMGIEEGADDYLNKPFDPQELVVRLKAVLRRTQQRARSLNSVQRLSADKLKIDRISRRVWVDNREVVVTPKAFAILEYLMTHPDELITRERLLDAVWGWANAVGMRVIDTRIFELRKALADDPLHPHFIETVTGQGYRFVAPVTATDSP